jgi:hypothetical protein
MPTVPNYTADFLTSGVNLKYPDCTIENGATVSSAINLLGSAPVKIFVPANFVGSEFTYLQSFDGVNFSKYYNVIGNEVKVLAGPNRFIGIVPFDLIGIRYLKIETPVAQTGCTFTIIAMDIN